MTSNDRRRLLVALLAATLLLAATVLFEVLATVVFTITVAYLLVPAERRVAARGVPPRLASALVAVGAVVVALVPVLALGFIIYLRRTELLAMLGAVPRTFVVELGGFTYTVDISVWLAVVQAELSTVAVTAATALPVFALKFSLFAFLLYALLLRSDDAARAVLAPIPQAYHDVVHALDRRIRATLYAIYVLQLATAAATFVLAIPVFVAFGYEFVVTLAFVAGVLQFVPIVGPSVLVVGLAAWEVSAGVPTRGIAVLLVGLVVIAGLPDLLVRPRLASETAGISGGLYFVGFVGGLLTLGPVGIVAGPLAVAILIEATNLLATDTREWDGPHAAPGAVGGAGGTTPDDSESAPGAADAAGTDGAGADGTGGDDGGADGAGADGGGDTAGDGQP